MTSLPQFGSLNHNFADLGICFMSTWPNNERYTFDDAGGVVRTRADGEKEVGVLFEDKLQGCDCKLMYEDGSSAYYKIEYSDSRLVFGQRTCSGHNEFFLMKQK
jgi:hypothetical protein